MAREFFDKRIVPTNPDSGRLVNNPPDTPPIRIDTVELRKPNGNSRNLTVALPFLEHQVIPLGGGRPIGGGTSKEALRRAKQKIKKDRQKS